MHISHPSHNSTERLLADRSGALLLRYAMKIGAPEACKQPFLGQGSVLNAILLQQAAAISGSEDHLLSAAEQLDHGAALLERLPLSSSLYRGIAGFGWAVETFARPELLPWRPDFVGDLDDVLAEGLEVTENLNIDIVNGLAGIMVYAIARGDTAPSSVVLWEAINEKVAHFLIEWRSRANAAHGREGAGNNLGVAHGVPGLLSVAVWAAARGLLPMHTRQLLLENIDFLWSVAINKGDDVYFPNRFGQVNPARLAWCYGGLGLAATFGNAAALDPINGERANRLCQSSLVQYRAGDHGIRDASLCHGHAGVAMAFGYLARAPWANCVLADKLRESAFVACSEALDSEIEDPDGPVFLHSTQKGMLPSASFLEGGPGIALALVASFTERPPTWMEVLAYY